MAVDNSSAPPDLLQRSFETFIDSYVTYHPIGAPATRPEGGPFDELSRELAKLNATAPEAPRTGAPTEPHPAEMLASSSRGDATLAAAPLIAPQHVIEARPCVNRHRNKDVRTDRVAKGQHVETAMEFQGSLGPHKKLQQGCARAVDVSWPCGQPVEASLDVVDAHPPIPAPFAGLAPALAGSLVPQTALASPAESAEKASEGNCGDPAAWAEYYRQCAEYYQQAAAAAVPSKQSSEAIPVEALISMKAATSSGPAAKPSLEASVPATSGFAPALGMPLTAGVSGLGVAPGPNLQPCPYASGPVHLETRSIPCVGGLGPCHTDPMPASSFAGFSPFCSPSAQRPNFVTPLTDPSPYPQHAMDSLPGAARLLVQRSAQGIGALAADEDGLANLLLAWYYSGYYTGLYAARQQH